MTTVSKGDPQPTNDPTNLDTLHLSMQDQIKSTSASNISERIDKLRDCIANLQNNSPNKQYEIQQKSIFNTRIDVINNFVEPLLITLNQQAKLNSSEYMVIYKAISEAQKLNEQAQKDLKDRAPMLSSEYGKRLTEIDKNLQTASKLAQEKCDFAGPAKLVNSWIIQNRTKLIDSHNTFQSKINNLKDKAFNLKFFGTLSFGLIPVFLIAGIFFLPLLVLGAIPIVIGVSCLTKSRSLNKQIVQLSDKRTTEEASIKKFIEELKSYRDHFESTDFENFISSNNLINLLNNPQLQLKIHQLFIDELQYKNDLASIDANLAELTIENDLSELEVEHNIPAQNRSKAQEINKLQEDRNKIIEIYIQHKEKNITDLRQHV